MTDARSGRISSLVMMLEVRSGSGWIGPKPDDFEGSGTGDGDATLWSVVPLCTGRTATILRREIR